MNMKTRTLSFIIICILCSITAGIFYVNADRPSAIDSAIKKAVREQNDLRLIKSLFDYMHDELEKDSESLPEIIRNIESYVEKCNDKTSKAVLHSAIAELYQQYYDNNRWKIDQRSKLEGFIPSDIREWTSNIFQLKIEEELTNSLLPAAVLQQTPVSKFDTLLVKGEQRELQPTLYDYLLHQAIILNPQKKWYDQLLSFRRSQPDKNALLISELDYLNFIHSSSIDKKQHEASLDSLFNIYKGNPYAAEIIINKIDLINRDYYNVPKEKRDSVNALLYNLYTDAIKNYGSYFRINIIKNRLAQFEQPNLNTSSEHNIYPGENFTIKLNYKNVPKIKIKLYRSDFEYFLNTSSEEKNSFRSSPIKEYAFDLPTNNSYSYNDTTIKIPMKLLGLYRFAIETPDSGICSKGLFSVSKLASVLRDNEHEQEVLVTDFKSGKPQKNVTVAYYTYNNKKRKYLLAGKCETNFEGLATLPQGKNYMIRTIFKDDSLALPSSLYYYNRNSIKSDNITVSLFTDRKIYRPGQTIFFKGIAYNNNIDNPQVIADKDFTVTLRDANHKEVKQLKLKTDQYGAFYGEFVLPKQTLNGIFTLSSEREQVSIRVEEYKRPTFRLEFTPIKDEVYFGKALTIQGNARMYSGMPIQKEWVEWTIRKEPFWLRSYIPNPYNQSTEQVASGRSAVDSEGNFNISFTPEREFSPANTNVFQSYTVSATLTDSKGETQETSYRFSVGDAGIVLVPSVCAIMDKDSASAKISAMTINRKNVPVSGSYTIYTLEEKKKNNEKTVRPEKFQEKDIVSTGLFSDEKQLVPEDFKYLPSGRYRILWKAADRNGKEVTAKSDFILYTQKDKCPPVFSPTWNINLKTECLPEENAEFIFGTSFKNVYALYEIFDASYKLRERRWIKLDNSCKRFEVPFKEIYGKGMVATFTFVKDGKLFSKAFHIYRKQPDKTILIHPQTFRDFLMPGNMEQWKFHITKSDSSLINAQVLASMYDASLDQIQPFRWSNLSIGTFYMTSPFFNEGGTFNESSTYDAKSISWQEEKAFEYDYPIWRKMLHELPRFYMESHLLTRTAGVKVGNTTLYSTAKKAVATPAAAAQNDVLNEESVVSTASDEGSGLFGSQDVAEELQQQESTAPSIRQNFSETAFFYPVLTTNNEGDIVFNFNMPESNTTWKLQLLAHSENLFSGYFTKEVVTSKPFMVQLNIPRFIRQKDKMSISAQLINLSETAKKGNVKIEFFNPEDNSLIQWTGKNSEQPFSLEANETGTVNWEFFVPEESYALVGCRVFAETEDGSDGEQHLIPVLSNDLYITESTPFVLYDNDEFKLTLPEAEGKYTIEICDNPIWYAIQALPTLETPQSDNIISWFASYYCNALSYNLVKTQPSIRQLIQKWSATAGDVSTGLLSKLEQNSDLKNILLEETPWITEAQNETERIQRLSLLFDENRAAQSRENALQQLQEQQNIDGGWAWFKGMPTSRSMTISILDGMAKLIELNAIQYNQREKEMQIRALNYLDKAIIADFERDQKNNPKQDKILPTSEQIYYLYVRSAYRDIPETNAREAIKFYTAQAMKSWNKYALFERAAIARLAFRNGDKKTAEEIVKWFKKTATTKKEKGMFWANNRRNNNWYNSPITTHVLIMNAFNEIAPDKELTDLQKTWLLSQKQVQNWNSVPATVDAIYALLCTGTDWNLSTNSSTVLWDGEKMEQDPSSLNNELTKRITKEIKKDNKKHTITIQREGDNPLWGAVYKQYSAPISEIQKAKTEALHIEKKLFFETNNGKERLLTPIKEGQTLHEGDKIVTRLTIRCDRDMDYVYLKDLRPGCMESETQISRQTYRDGVFYYISPKDASENIYFDRLPKGTFVIEYTSLANRKGIYAGGICTIQCLYAPEFISHTESHAILIK